MSPLEFGMRKFIADFAGRAAKERRGILRR